MGGGWVFSCSSTTTFTVDIFASLGNTKAPIMRWGLRFATVRIDYVQEICVASPTRKNL